MFERVAFSVRCTICVLVGSSCAMAQIGTWVERDPEPEGRVWTAMVTDTVRNRVVLFGGEDNFGFDVEGNTYEWDGEQWELVSTTGPSARAHHAMAYDPVRERVVLYGGLPGGDELWEWDGTTWTQITPPGTRPGSMSGHAMAFDGVRQRVILYDGLSATWEWDGLSWTRLTTAANPGEQPDDAMAYDPIAQKILYLADPETWAWDGAVGNWSRLSATGVNGFGLAYDAARGQMIAYGGSSVRVWNWSTSTWTSIPCPSVDSGEMAYDPNTERVLSFIRNPFDYRNSCFAWNGVRWDFDYPGPGPRGSHAMAYDSLRDRIVLFGGFGFEIGTGPERRGDTWEFDGQNWLNRTPASSPAARAGAGMAFDASRGRILMMGGRDDSNSPMGDTWEWDGELWREIVSAGPGRRGYPRMAYDPDRQKAVLFGGNGPNNETLRDTWEYDATNESWQQVTMVGWTPPIDSANRLEFDTYGGAMILLADRGGRTEIWQYDPALPGWSPISIGGPSLRRESGVTYDTLRQKLVVVGGASLPPRTSSDETWEWDSESALWRYVADGGFEPDESDPIAPMQHGGACVFDPIRQRTVLFGGGMQFQGSTGLVLRDTWLWSGPGSEVPPTVRLPVRRIAAVGETVVLAASVSGSEPLTYQWRKGTSDLADGENPDGSSYSGTNTWTLTITNIGLAEDGEFELRVSRPGTSHSARVDVVVRPCLGDINGDGGVGLADLAFLLSDFGGIPPSTFGDLDSDLDVDVQDLALLLAEFGQDCE